MNDSPRVEEATRKRVRRIAEHVGYHKNEIARSLVTRRTKIIGLVVPDISNPFFAEVTKGVELPEPAGYNTILCDSSWDVHREQEHLRILRGQRVGGSSSTSPGTSPQSRPGAEVTETPLVEIRSSGARDALHRVSIDNVRGAQETTAYLTSLGHRRIAHVTGDIRRTQARYSVLLERLEGYRRALEKAIRYDESLVIDTGSGVQLAHQSVLRFLRANPAVTALFAASDVMALGAYRAAHELGLRIPQDLSVARLRRCRGGVHPSAGADHLRAAPAPAGEAATEMLVRLMNGHPPSRLQERVETRAHHPGVVRRAPQRRQIGERRAKKAF